METFGNFMLGMILILGVVWGLLLLLTVYIEVGVFGILVVFAFVGLSIFVGKCIGEG